MLEAVLFDLDDTLVIADNDALMKEYFTRVAGLFAGVVAPRRLQQQIVDSTLYVLNSPDGHSTALELFADHFFTRLELPVDMSPFMEFYAGEYGELGRFTRPAPAAKEAVEFVLALGLKVAVATNPVFPRVAVERRLGWAGLEGIPWHLVTTAESMRYCKPHPQYFADVAGQLGVPPQACLMVGNDPHNDMPAAGAGMRTYLVTGNDAARDEALQTFLLSADRDTPEPASLLAPDFVGNLASLPAVVRQLVQCRN